MRKFQEDLHSSFGGVDGRMKTEEKKKNNNNTHEKTNGTKTIRFPFKGNLKYIVQPFRAGLTEMRERVN